MKIKSKEFALTYLDGYRDFNSFHEGDQMSISNWEFDSYAASIWRNRKFVKLSVMQVLMVLKRQKADGLRL